MAKSITRWVSFLIVALMYVGAVAMVAAVLLPLAAHADEGADLTAAQIPETGEDSGRLMTAMALDGDGSKAMQVAAKGTHAAAVLDDGSVWTWGGNSKPAKVMTGATHVAVGSQAFAAIKSDGSLWTWGSGYLGNGSSTTRTSPVKVMDGVKQVAVGSSHMVALKTDGSVWAWGSNSSGELGDGTKTARAYPVKVMVGAVSVAAGGWSTAAVKTNGTLWVWGVGITGSTASPSQIATGVAQASLTVFGAAANGRSDLGYVKTDGSLWLGSLLEQSFSKTMDGVVSVDMGLAHNAAVKKDGTLWSWGSNYRGQIGDGTVVDRGNPVKVLGDVSQVAVGGMQYNQLGTSFTVALKKDGTIWTWGSNTSCQLGDGTTEDKASPICIFRDGKWLTDDTYHFADEVPERAALQKLLSRMYWYDNDGADSGKNYDYDSAKAATYKDNIIANLIRHKGVSVASLTDGTYPVTVFVGSGMKKTDPLGKFSEYLICDASAVKWVAQNIFNVSDADYATLQNAGDNPNWSKYYYRDGKYYVQTGGVGGLYQDIAIMSAKKSGDRWDVFFRIRYGQTEPSKWYSSETQNDSTYLYAQVGSKTIDGNKYWSLYKLSESPIPASGESNEGNSSGVESGLSTYAGKAKAAGFTDLDLNAWYMGAGGTFPESQTLYLDYTIAKGLMSGYAGTTLFGPDDDVTRAQAATIIYRMATGKTAGNTDNNVTTKFSDVPKGAYYAAAVKWCSECGVVTGYNDANGKSTGKFGPDDKVTREQLTAMIARYCTGKAGMKSAGSDVSRFKDAGKIAEWAREGVAFCAANAIVSGIGDTGNFQPQGLATRCQMAKIIAVTAYLLE